MSDLRGNRDFRVVLGGQAISAFGDAVSLTVMPLLVLALTGSGALMGLVGTLELLPGLVLGLPAGALADRWDRRRMMLWSDVGRAVLTAAIPVVHWLGSSATAAILIVVVPLNALRVLWTAGFTSAVPNLVERDDLARANSYFEAVASVGFVLGPAVAGVLVATIGPASTLVVDAGTFVASAASLTLVRRPLRAQRTGVVPRLRADILDGLRFVWAHGQLRALIAFWSAVGVATAAVLPALAYHITIDNGLGTALFGFVGSTWSVGYLCGSLLAGRLDPRSAGRWMLGASALIGAMLITVGATASAPGYLASAFGIGAGLGIVLVLYLTVRASLTPDELLGRVGSTARTVALGLQVLVVLVAGAVIEASNGGVALVGMGAFAIIATLLFARSGALELRAVSSAVASR